MRSLLLTPLVLVLAALDLETSRAQDGADIMPNEPRIVVARWLELHRTGQREAASALTTGSLDHRANVLLPTTRDTGVRVARSLGNERVAAVVTGSLEDSRDGERVLLFWLVRQDHGWRINKSNSFEKQVVDERLRGFWEAGDARWHVGRDQVIGNWEAGPCYPPGTRGVACGRALQLVGDGTYKQLHWGPGGPDLDGVMQGEWRIVDGAIVLSREDQTLECVVTWLDDGQLEIASSDGSAQVTYDRSPEPEPGDIGSSNPLVNGKL